MEISTVTNGGPIEIRRKLSQIIDELDSKHTGGLMDYRLPDDFGPKYRIYKESLSYSLTFCDYSNNCYV